MRSIDYHDTHPPFLGHSGRIPGVRRALLPTNCDNEGRRSAEPVPAPHESRSYTSAPLVWRPLSPSPLDRHQQSRYRGDAPSQQSTRPAGRSMAEACVSERPVPSALRVCPFPSASVVCCLHVSFLQLHPSSYVVHVGWARSGRRRVSFKPVTACHRSWNFLMIHCDGDNRCFDGHRVR